ncbi:hypothetical protein SPRG_04922 [Saprolegnia parasitica CBS 223.65]|uniref:Uncharacterized protein n=1 Tax=Saprolegnia parasitica (strain CBS 223.65) TaxID=695850 RepID=A0A067CSN3_SAPPC|nr:hypothetical protein SPRG_04922 [Saprolegnia parasitica CBS 223.65]KDO29807.1 hypothetical protein SPRG_04922 [Saprolegnia parasitica CBS 223.65]|eukprot:XP_012199450.1 hypothetical protein SPRG_04922 [Saprolegnia parasitica CBS 223.65]
MQQDEHPNEPEERPSQSRLRQKDRAARTKAASLEVDKSTRVPGTRKRSVSPRSENDMDSIKIKKHSQGSKPATTSNADTTNNVEKSSTPPI